MEDIKSYRDKENDILGCEHYPRSCRIKAVCCDKYFVCRLCHNNNSNHEIDRFATKLIQCMRCTKEQPVAEKCIQCDTVFARYFCFHCKFFDDTPDKSIFHCADCKICRVGKRDEYKHCFRCNGCLSISGFDKHKCMENKYERCPVCLEDMFYSREGSISLNCGHALHESCYKSLLESNHMSCPICKKIIYNNVDWKKMDRMLERQPMPPQYKGSTCSVLCNDCESKSMGISFHFLGNKCEKCGSYNTTIISKDLKFDENAQPETNSNNNNNNNNEENDEEDEEDADDDDFFMVEEDDDDDEDEDDEDYEHEDDEEVEDALITQDENNDNENQ